MRAENGDTHQERGVHALLFIILPNAQRSDMAPIWPIPQGLVCRGMHCSSTCSNQDGEVWQHYFLSPE